MVPATGQIYRYKENQMKNKLIPITTLLALALLSAACAGQQATNEPAEATTLPAVSGDQGPATEDATEAPTAPAEGETNLTPTVSSEGGTPGTTGTAAIPETGLGNAGVPDNLDDVLLVLRETGATVDVTDPVESDVLSVPGQIVFIDNEEVEFYTYESVEAAEAQRSLVADLVNAQGQPQFYTLGNMLVRYVGSDPGVRDLLEDVLGAQEGGR
jgi:hypothetical protein